MNKKKRGKRRKKEGNSMKKKIDIFFSTRAEKRPRGKAATVQG